MDYINSLFCSCFYNFTISSKSAALWLHILLVSISISLRSKGSSDWSHISFLCIVSISTKAVRFLQYCCYLLSVGIWAWNFKIRLSFFLKKNLDSWLVLCCYISLRFDFINGYFYFCRLWFIIRQIVYLLMVFSLLHFILVYTYLLLIYNKKFVLNRYK
jgi:hypothetical protein